MIANRKKIITLKESSGYMLVGHMVFLLLGFGQRNSISRLGFKFIRLLPVI